MKILLYGINFTPELTGIGKYSGELGQWLADQGHEVRVITAPPYYPEWHVWPGYSSWRYFHQTINNLTIIRCPLYVPAKVSALKRLIHLASFSATSFFAVIKQVLWKPERIILVVPTLFCAPQALLLAKITGAKSLLHIQDYEVDALFGLGLAKGGVLKSLAFTFERRLLLAFDSVSTISSGMLRRALEKGVPSEKLFSFQNWSEIDRFKNIKRSPEMMERLGVPAGKRVLLYSGNIGDKQGLEVVVDAAEKLSNREELFFLVVGEGAGKDRIMDRAKQKKLPNIAFAPLQSYEDLPALLALADCHLVIQKRGAADAVLPSKLTNILASGGNAVITADRSTSLGQLCDEHPGIAICVEPESVNALIEGINRCLSMPQENTIASRYANENLDKEMILQRFMNVMRA